MPGFRTELQSAILQYDLEDVYNADETGLYWKLEPHKSLASGPISGLKKPKDRTTIMLTCNATGTHKLPLLFQYSFINIKIHAVFTILINEHFLCNITGTMYHGYNALFLKHGSNNLTEKYGKGEETSDY